MPPAPESVIQRGFGAGELAPVLHARADHEKYLSGLKTCRNFQVLRHGAVANRAGTRFVGESKTTSANKRLMRYVSQIVDQSILIEAGASYFRFYKNGALVSLSGAATAWNAGTNYVAGDLANSGGVNYYCKLAHINFVPPNATYWYPLTGLVYEVPHTFTSGGLFNWVQSGTIITLTHRDHKPQELIYFADTNWVLRDINTAPVLTAPLNLALAPIAGAEKHAYIITAGALESYEESLPSNVVSNAAMASPTAAAPHVLTWDVLAGVAEYYIYHDPYGNGTYGYVGSASTNLFRNPGLAPDFNVTPPPGRTLFASTNNYPHVAAYYQQRRFFGYTNNDPEAIYGSRTGFPSNFGISSPLQDDDAVSFRIAGSQHHPVRHMVGLKTLVVGTDAGAWTVGQSKIPLTPSNLPADQESGVGMNEDVRPVVVDNSIVFVQARGSIVRDLQYNIEVDGFNGRDLTLFASHLFDGYAIDSIDFAQAPHSTVWCVRSDGTLLGLTYVREQDVWGWHRHDTGGSDDFEQVCIVPEGTEDAVYVMVRRTVGGVSKRYIEKLESREILSFDADAFFVDSGLSYSGAPATVFTGLDHLNGRTVVALADGTAIGGIVVVGGSITLATAATNVHAGLPIVADFETLDLDAGGTAVRDKAKRVGSVTVLVERSARSFYAGPNSTSLIQNVLGITDNAADEFTGQVEINLETNWEKPGRVFIQHTDPLPLTILGIMPNLIAGG